MLYERTSSTNLWLHARDLIDGIQAAIYKTAYMPEISNSHSLQSKKSTHIVSYSYTYSYQQQALTHLSNTWY